MLLSLLVVFTLVVSGSTTLSDGGAFSGFRGIGGDTAVSRLYRMMMSKLSLDSPGVVSVLDLLLRPPTNSSFQEIREKILGEARTRTFDLGLNEYVDGVRGFRKTKCGKSLLSIGDYLRQAMKLSTSCHVIQHQNKTLQWNCHPNRNIRKLEKLLWVLSLFDSWGRASPGLSTQGQFLWYGDYAQCLEVRVPDESSRFSPAHYCMLQSGSLEMQMTREPESYLEDPQISRVPLIFKIGLCLPRTCGSEEIGKMIRVVEGLVEEVNGTGWKGPERSVVSHCSTGQRGSLSIGTILTLSAISFLVFLVFIGTVMDWCEEKGWFKKKKKRCFPAGDGVSGANVISPSSRLIRRSRMEDPLSFKSLTSVRRTLKKPRWWMKILIAFSLRLNLAWIFHGEVLLRGRNGKFRYHRSTDPRSDHVTCLFGLKVLSMAWIVAGHTHLFSLGYMSNLAVFAEKFRKQFLAQLILNASLSVDTFFFISGFLVTYVWYRRTERNSGSNMRKPEFWALLYFHRWIRLTPAYALVIGFTLYVYPKMGYGPNWKEDDLFGAQCTSQDWWKHLLFISNFLRSTCLPWMWFLAVEMQLFLVTPLLLVLYWKSGSWGLVITLALILISGVGRGIWITDQKFPPNLLLLLPASFNQDIQSFFYTVYAMPYMRAGPFLVGIVFGWRLASKGHRMGSLRFRNKWKTKLYWILSLALAFWCLFGAYPLYLGFSNSLYNFLLGAFSRTLWALSVGMIVELCHTDSGHFFNKVLSWTGWRPFSRLTYSAYLSHELVLLWYFQSAHHPEHFEGYIQMTVYSMGFVFLAYAAALPLNLLAESPPLALERLLFKRYPRRPQKRNHLLPTVCRRGRINGWIHDPHVKFAHLPESTSDIMEEELNSEETDPTQSSEYTSSLFSFDMDDHDDSFVEHPATPPRISSRLWQTPFFQTPENDDSRKHWDASSCSVSLFDITQSNHPSPNRDPEATKPETFDSVHQPEEDTKF